MNVASTGCTRWVAKTAAIVALVLMAGCSSLPDDAVQQIGRARVALDRGRYNQCRDLVTPVIRRYGSNPDTAEALYLRAIAELRLGKRSAAERDCAAALRIVDDSQLRAWINVQLGNFAYDDGLFSQARLYYERAVDDLPDAPPADQALFRYGDTLLKLNHFAEGRKAFVDLLHRFPKSPLAASASRKQGWDGNYFTVQCGAFDRVDLAHKAAAHLRQQGFSALAFPDPHQPLNHHVVRVGRYSTYGQARQALIALQKIQPDAFILP